ncbi:hypothetical protein CUU64_09870 [Bacillus sp. V5-8f]|nr:hypothetical protein CUU64_09870 [Bacillus sp. V5-8f]
MITMDELFDTYNSERFIKDFQAELAKGTVGSNIEIEQYLHRIANSLDHFSMLKSALDVSVIVAATNTKGKILYANDKFCEISKYSREELIGKDHRILNSGFHDQSFFKNMWKTIKQGKVWEGEIKNKAKDGSYYWIKTTIVPIHGPKRLPEMFISFRTDITEGKLAQESLVEALQNDFRLVTNSMNNLIFKIIKVEHNQFVYSLNRGKLAYELGLENEKMQDKTPHEVFPSDLADMFETQYETAFSGKSVNYTYSYNGRHLLTYLSPVFQEGKVVEVIGCINDITDLHDAQEEVHYIAFHDLLTNLPNRRKFNDDITEIVAQSQKDQSRFAVFFIDLDRFKQINDSLGHTMGDHLIRAVSARLLNALDSKGHIYRLAGDEFIIIMPGIEDEGTVSMYAKQIISMFVDPFLLPNSHKIFTTASIGISIFPEHGEDYDTLLKNADTAMYAAKSFSRNTFSIYVPEMNKHQDETLMIEQFLHRGIENNELELYYQPKMDLLTGQIKGMEALLRWNRECTTRQVYSYCRRNGADH